jgi:AraC-like DNA-binding protein
MLYKKFNPAEELRPFVECYFIWEAQVEPSFDLLVESPPNGYCSIVFNYGDPYHLQNSKYEKLLVPRQFIAGQSIYSYKLYLSGRVGLAGIVLKPTALATLYNLPAFEFTEERTDLLKFFEASFIQPYIKKINRTNGIEEKVKVLEALVLHQLHTRQPETDFIDEAAGKIIEARGLLHMSELIKNSYMSRRTFERKFFQKVGLSPKFYARIRRIGYLCHLIAGKQKVNWQELLYKSEFYDQAHFIKDFEAFTGRTPQQYLLENKELANYVKKSGTQNIKY